MTLGGLALAVGILVDEATVTIENINWHLEQGKEVEQAILDGAEQIVTPAFVSLLCICIVFVPMFFLTGVPRFLFVPLAEAVMSAMVWSFILSRTLVPTMAKYMLRKHEAHTDAHGAERAAAALTQSAGALPARLRVPLRARPSRLSRGFDHGDAAPRRVRHALPRLHCRQLRAGALSRPRFLPVGRRRPHPDARARAMSAPASRKARGCLPKSRRWCGRPYRRTNWKRWSTISVFRSAAST